MRWTLERTAFDSHDSCMCRQSRLSTSEAENRTAREWPSLRTMPLSCMTQGCSGFGVLLAPPGAGFFDRRPALIGKTRHQGQIGRISTEATNFCRNARKTSTSRLISLMSIR